MITRQLDFETPISKLWAGYFCIIIHYDTNLAVALHFLDESSTALCRQTHNDMTRLGQD